MLQRTNNISVSGIPLENAALVLLESFPLPAFIIDVKGIVLAANHKGAALCGKGRELCQIGTTSLYDALFPVYPVARQKQAHGLKTACEEVLRTGIQRIVEDNCAGEKVRYSLAPIASPEGNLVIQLLVTVQESSSRNSHADEHYKEISTYNAILETAIFSFSIMDEKGRMVEWNQYMSDNILGATGDASRNGDVFTVIHPDDREYVRERFHKVLCDGIEDACEVRVFRCDQSRYEWQKISGRRIMIDGYPCVMVVGIDITLRKYYESLNIFRLRLIQMAESYSVKELMQAMLDEAMRLTESAAAYVHILSDDLFPRSMQAWSTGFVNNGSLTGLQEEGHPADPENAGIWEEVIQERKAVICNDSASHGNGGALPGHCCMIIRELAVPLIKDGKVTALVGVINKKYKYGENDTWLVQGIVDVSREIIVRKLAEESEKKIQEQLIQSQKIELVGQLAGGIAHDYNNVLAAILGYTEMLLEKVTDAHPFFENLEHIRTATIRSSSLTRQLLAFVRRQQTVPSRIELDAAIEKMLPMISQLIGKNIRIEWHPESMYAGVSMDASQLDQIVINLCLNARDAISGSGTIKVKTGIVHIDAADCTTGHPCLVQGDFVRLSVSDTGHGIKKKDFPHIYEPFFTTKEVGKGSGLGLSTIYGIVKQNSGYIDCMTEEGNGTTFNIFLPVDRNAARHDEAFPFGQQTKTILLVEDEPDILHLVGKILETKGHKVLSASDAEQAIEMVKKQESHLSLLITDVVLPKMNGVQLSITLQASVPELKTLFMSGYAPDMIAHHRIFDPEVDFIQKPFAISDFMKLVGQMLSCPLSCE